MDAINALLTAQNGVLYDSACTAFILVGAGQAGGHVVSELLAGVQRAELRMFHAAIASKQGGREVKLRGGEGRGGVQTIDRFRPHYCGYSPTRH